MDPCHGPVAFVGFKAEDLPYSSLILARSVVEQNIKQLHRDFEDMGLGFGPRADALKGLEMRRWMLGNMLGNGRHSSVICSTMAEIKGASALAKEGVLDEAIYCNSFTPSELPSLSEYRSSIRIILLVENQDQIEALESFMAFSAITSPWPIFLEIDGGDGWSGVSSFSERVEPLANIAGESKVVDVLGIHADTRFASVEDWEKTYAESSERMSDSQETDKKARTLTETMLKYPVSSMVTFQEPDNAVSELPTGQTAAGDVELQPS
ncbi:hypothetical protein ACHAPT_009948 [Fusarium lateritium]